MFLITMTEFSILHHWSGLPLMVTKRSRGWKNPEGRYVIDRKNPNSKFHLSLGISYQTLQTVHMQIASANRQAAISLSTVIRI